MKHYKKYAAFAVVALCVGSLSYAIAIQANPETPTEEVPSAISVEELPLGSAQGVGPRMDIAFVIDATGSMGDEIDNIKSEVWSIAKKMATGKPRPDVRFALVLYKDTGDDFLTQVTPFTRDVPEIKRKLDAIVAQGGGDIPEHVGRGLHDALDLGWDLHAPVRSIYLVGDARSQSHNDGKDVASAIQRANAKHIVINTIGCSGLDGSKTEFAQIASLTQGRFEPLTYQTVVEDDDGTKKSIVVYDGKTYEAAGVLDKKEWNRGGGGLIKSGKLKPARPKMKRRGRSKGFFNNLGSSVKFQMVDDAVQNKVTF